MSKNINIKTLDVSKKEFFNLWLLILKPYHKLRNKEIEILTLFLLKRYELSKVISDDSLIDTILFSTKTRNEIKDEMGYSSLQVVGNMLDSLKKKGVIVDMRIIKGLIPNLSNSKTFQLIFNFNINET